MPENDELKKYLDYDGLAYLLQRFPKTTVHCTFDSEFAGETATLTHGTTTYTKTVPATSPYELTFAVNELGTWTLQSSYLGTQYSDSVDITYLGQKGEIELTIVPDGSTAEPINSIPIWLKCANLNKSYTTLAEVLADTETYETLLADSNACQYMKRSTGWASAEGLVPTMTDNTHPSGVASASSEYSAGTVTYGAWRAFDKNTTDSAYESTSNTNQWLAYEFNNPVRVNAVEILGNDSSSGYDNYSPKDFNIEYSDDGSTWITDETDFQYVYVQGSNDSKCFYSPTLDGSHKYWRVFFKNTWGGSHVTVRELQFYEADITHNQDAMARLGKFDYASNLLLSDSTWCGAILNSDYFESVCNYNVPAMTSNTTPEGEASASSVHSNQYAYMAFDRAMNHGWHSGAGANQWLQYRFVKPIVLKKVKLGSYNAGGPKVTMVQGSNDGSTWSDIGNFQDCPTAGVYYINNYADNNTAYTYIRLAFSASNYIVSNQHYYANIIAQFWGRASEEVLVPLVPTMTSDTTPSGLAFCGPAINESYPIWKAFDGDDSTFAHTVSTTTGDGHYIGYKFDTLVRANKFTYYCVSTGRKPPTAYLQASNDSTNGADGTWTTLYTLTNTGQETASFDNNIAYRWYRILGNGLSLVSGSYGFIVNTLQLYAKTVQTNIIHSTPNDTIYMLEDGDPIVLATTNSDGDGILDFSQLPAGPVTLYSSVAKNPDDLSADYSKTITITKTQYGGTTEAYLMPDTVGTKYWYGYITSDVKDISQHGSDFTVANGYTTPACTYNTNNISSTQAGNTQRGIYTTDIPSWATKAKAVLETTYVNSAGCHIITGAKGTSLNGWTTYSSPSINSVMPKTLTVLDTLMDVIAPRAWNNCTFNIYAFWFE